MAATASEKRQALRDGLGSGRLLRFPGAFSPLVARAVAEHGFDGVYVSGAALSADLGLPDIGLTTLDEVAGRGGAIARATALPTLVDADTGFGETVNVARAIAAFEQGGLAGCHLEDQVSPKRCGHLDHKQLVARDEMVRKIRSAVTAREDGGFVICARTDARTVEGVEAAVERAKAYVDAGADMVFPEALEGPSEFERFREAMDVPLLANMTEFGKSPLLDTATLESIGFNMVIWPVSTLRIAMGAIEELLRTLSASGSQQAMVERMQTRARLYELVGYEDYRTVDEDVFNFRIPGGGG